MMSAIEDTMEKWKIPRLSIVEFALCTLKACCAHFGQSIRIGETTQRRSNVRQRDAPQSRRVLLGFRVGQDRNPWKAAGTCGRQAQAFPAPARIASRCLCSSDQRAKRGRPSHEVRPQRREGLDKITSNSGRGVTAERRLDPMALIESPKPLE
jgi:hypothetical protein